MYLCNEFLVGNIHLLGTNEVLQTINSCQET